MSADYSHILTEQDLKDEILNLRIRSIRQKDQIETAVQELKVSVQPMNLLRQALHALKNTGSTNTVIQSALGLGAGWLGKKALFKKRKGFFPALWSTGVEIFLTRIVSRSLDARSIVENKWVNIIMNAGKKSGARGRKQLPATRS